MSESFVRSGDRERALAEVKSRAARFGAALQEFDLQHGDRYAVVMRNEIAFLEATLAAPVVGAVPVPVNWHWTGEDLRHILIDSRSRIAVVHSDLIPAIEEQGPPDLQIIEAAVPQEVRDAYRLGAVPLTGRFPVMESLIESAGEPETTQEPPPMSVIYTSGTTGRPKGIMRHPIPPENAKGLLDFVSEFLSMQPGWTTVLPAPLYHSAPNSNATFGAALGMNLIIMPRFDPEELLRLVEKHRVDSIQLVPTMFVRLLQLPEHVRTRYDLSSLKSVVHAAAPCPPDVKRKMLDWLGPIISEYYGGSEGGAWVNCTSQEWLTHPGTVGKPMTGAAVKIVDEHMQELPAGETGIIYGRSSPYLPDFTYIGDDGKRKEIELDDGFITVGDVGRLDDDGFLYLTDRLNDMVISGGVNIYPAEIETTLMGLAGVADVAVFGVPDQAMGEALAAHVQVQPGANVTEDDVKEYARTQLAGYKVPRVVVFEDELPREDSGKLFKRVLKQPYWQEA